MNTDITYQRLGDYIREVNLRNRELKVTEPMGINIDKHFMPSVANVIGTDLSAYKMVCKNQFACNLMHVGRDEKIPMAMWNDANPIIVSPAYFVFEITKTEDLLPEYLMMWFRRAEFDRNAWFYTDADVRGGMNIFHSMQALLPATQENYNQFLTEGQKIVSEAVESIQEADQSARESNAPPAETNDSGNQEFSEETPAVGTAAFNDRYMELAQNPEANEEQPREMVEEAAESNGYTIRAYHGTSRSDRVGTVFLPERATSGPMAFFTSDPEIAANYAKDKADTSLSYDDRYDSYYTQFRAKDKNGNSVAIGEIWNDLPARDRSRIREAAPCFFRSISARRISLAQPSVNEFRLI